MEGKTTKVEALQTATGTKDKIAQYWIDLLIAKHKQIKSERPDLSSEKIVEELKEWYDAQPGDNINPLLLLEGTYFNNVCVTPSESVDI